MSCFLRIDTTQSHSRASVHAYTRMRALIAPHLSVGWRLVLQINNSLGSSKMRPRGSGNAKGVGKSDKTPTKRRISPSDRNENGTRKWKVYHDTPAMTRRSAHPSRLTARGAALVTDGTGSENHGG